MVRDLHIPAFMHLQTQVNHRTYDEHSWGWIKSWSVGTCGWATL